MNKQYSNNVSNSPTVFVPISSTSLVNQVNINNLDSSSYILSNNTNAISKFNWHPDQNTQAKQYPLQYHIVNMKNLPPSITENDILQFFLPLRPFLIIIYCNNFGHKTGEADVQFNSYEEASKAMSGNQQFIRKFINF